MTDKSDVYSLGCVFYYMLTGQHLFTGASLKHIIYNNVKADLNKVMLRESLSHVSHNGKELLRMMLANTQARRPSA